MFGRGNSTFTVRHTGHETGSTGVVMANRKWAVWRSFPFCFCQSCCHRYVAVNVFLLLNHVLVLSQMVLNVWVSKGRKPRQAHVDNMHTPHIQPSWTAGLNTLPADSTKLHGCASTLLLCTRNTPPIIIKGLGSFTATRKILDKHVRSLGDY